MALLSLLAFACRRDTPRFAPLARLVDPAFRQGAEVWPPTLATTGEAAALPFPAATRALPTATIRDDTRYVLAAHPHLVIARRLKAEVSEGGSLDVALALGDALPSAERLVLDASVRARKRWLPLPPRLAEVEAGPAGRRVRIVGGTGELAPGSSTELVVTAHQPPAQKRTRYRTGPVAIVRGAWLEFATGILEPAAGEGPVAFVVSACRDDCRPIFRAVVDPADQGFVWHAARVPLDELANGVWSFLFETEHLADHPGAFTLPVWANPTIWAPTSPSGASLVLISIDTLRADHLESYGYSRQTSPFLEELAGSGAVFENLIAAATSTDPSHMTMFTSLWPSEHGVTRRMAPLRAPVATFAECVRSAGFATAAFTENGPLARERGFGYGFEIYRENKSASVLDPEGHVEETFGQARGWLDGMRGRRFFLFLHTFQVHAPYSPPPEYARLFGDETGPTAQRPGAPSSALTNYDREIRYVDEELRSLVDWMEAEGLLDDTLLVVTSDHGEAFREHGLTGHATPPYEEVLRVPLIVRGPGIAAGRRFAQPISHVDLMPTLLELLGVEAPPRLRGRSLAGLLRGATSEHGDAPPIFSEAWGLPEPFAPPALAVRLGRRKLIRHSTGDGYRYEYYDLDRDGRELRDLYAEAEAEAEPLRRLLEGHADELARSAPHGWAEGEQAPLVDVEREEKLRALGYVE